MKKLLFPGLFLVFLFSVATGGYAITAQEYYKSGNEKIQAKDYKGALADLNSAVALDNKNEAYYLRRGEVLEIIGEQMKAFDDYEKAIQLKPDDGMGYLRRARLELDLGYQRALEDSNKAVTLMPSNVDALILRGRLRMRQGDHENGMEDLNKALSLDPSRENEIGPLLRMEVPGECGG